MVSIKTDPHLEMKSLQAVHPSCRFPSKGDVHCGKEVLEMDEFESLVFTIGIGVI